MERYRAMMTSFLSARYPSLEADDLIQETLITLMRILPDYRYEPEERGHFHNYLIGILRNKARSEIVRRARQNNREIVFARDLSDSGGTDSDGLRIAAYEVALRQLLSDPSIHERTKQIFIRTAIDGESPESVADAFGVNRNAVDQMKSRMTGKLRGIISALESAGATE